MISVFEEGVHCKLRLPDRTAILFESTAPDFTLPNSVIFDAACYPVCGVTDDFLLELLSLSISIPPHITFIVAKQFDGLDFGQIILAHSPDSGWCWCPRARAHDCTSTSELSLPACDALAVPDSIEVIEAGAFCGAVASVTFSASSRLREVHGFACCALTAIIVPDSVEVIGPFAFFGCTALESLSLAESSRMRELRCFAAKPEKPDHAMALQSLFVPAGVAALAGFSVCPLLESVRFAAGAQLREIAGLSRLAVEEIAIPDSVVEINGLSYCSRLVRLRFGPRAQLRRLRGVSKNEALVEIDIPDSVEEIDGFQECPRLQEMRFGQASRLREFNGLNDNAIGEIRFPDFVESLNVLSFCNTLRRVEFGPSPRLRSIRGFDCVSNIVDFFIPDSIETVDILSGARSLQAIRFGPNPSLREINGFTRTSIVELTIPETVDSIVGFNLCSKLRELKFGPNPRIRKLQGFKETALNVLNQPDSVEEVVGFESAKRLTAVNFGERSRLRVIHGFEKTMIERFVLPAGVEEFGIAGCCTCREIVMSEQSRVQFTGLKIPRRTFVSVPESVVRRSRQWAHLRFAAAKTAHAATRPER
jgi:hypothetical protein